MNKRKFSLIAVIILTVLSIGITVGCAEKNTSENEHRYVIEVNGKYGYINKKGEEVIKPQYDYAGDFSEGLAPVCNNIDKEGHQKCGYINNLGKIQIPLRYSFVNGFLNNLAYFYNFSIKTKKTESGFINTNGKVIIDTSNYSEVGDFHENLAYVCKPKPENQQQCGYINEKGRIIVPLKYGYASDFSEGLAVVNKFNNDGRRLLNESGYIDKTGKLVLKGDYGYDFSNNLASNTYCSGYIDKTGKEIVDISRIGTSGIDGICSYFNDGLLLIRLKNDYFGYVNKKGELAIKTNAKTDEDYTPLAPSFSEGLAYIEINNKWGFIDKTGKIIIQPRFKRDFDGNIFEAMKFKNGLAGVKENNKYGYIDKSGKFVWSQKIK